MTEAPPVPACFKGGPLNSCSLKAVPLDARIIYVTHDASNSENVRWAAWTASQEPGTVPALVVDPGESVYVYKIVSRPNPFAKIRDDGVVKNALLFEFWSEGASVQDTLCEEHGGEKTQG